MKFILERGADQVYTIELPEGSNYTAGLGPIQTDSGELSVYHVEFFDPTGTGLGAFTNVTAFWQEGIEPQKRNWVTAK